MIRERTGRYLTSAVWEEEARRRHLLPHIWAPGLGWTWLPVEAHGLPGSGTKLKTGAGWGGQREEASCHPEAQVQGAERAEKRAGNHADTDRRQQELVSEQYGKRTGSPAGRSHL